MHHADARVDGLAHRQSRPVDTEQPYAARARVGEAGRDAHQRGLARAILAKQSVHRARIDGQVDVL